ncbi:MAG: glycerate kinase [Oscillospiraceae bacterium]|nr:glycerate kinase [Oscillospiraceae bacterium]
MTDKLRQDAEVMIKRIIAENMPGTSVRTALEAHTFTGNIYLVAIGKAAWTMAKAASEFLGDQLKSGIVITKYDHAAGSIDRVEIVEAGHPISDENTIRGTEKAIALAEKLGDGDELLFLVSGGGSALFEAPREGISLADIAALNGQLLASGADIVEINMVRKRLSKVKAGRFAQIAAPAKIFAVVLSDVLGDRLDSIASGPAAPDLATVEDVQRVAEAYKLSLSELQKRYLLDETPKEAPNVETVITGSVKTLCESAKSAALELGYTPVVLTASLNCEAREAGRFLAGIAADIKSGASSFKAPCAIIAGGETVVQLKGAGKGGRNQELAFAAARGLGDLNDVLLFSLGSDGTDGPTDAAGGMVDNQTAGKLREMGIDPARVLAENDCYHGLKAVDGLIITGPTGTNVNDVAVLLCR